MCVGFSRGFPPRPCVKPPFMADVNIVFRQTVRRSCLVTDWLLTWTVASMLVCNVTFTVAAASPNSGHPLLCWQAVLQCQAEPECRYAYAQYAQACSSVLRGRRRSCPSHCVSSLVQLNMTAGGPALERCECARDATCSGAKRAIEPCLPRTSGAGAGGCTEARRECERDAQCAAAVRDYLHQCRGLLGYTGSGREGACTDGCRRVIARMRAMPKARPLDTCVCDGAERTICEYIKASMKTLCFGSSDALYAGSGFFSDDEDDLEGDEGEEDYEAEEENEANIGGGNFVLVAAATISVLTHLH
ncbi:growth arrest-specific protein 1b [Pygocentrus nattereri]|uniref:growth arrest-specific protein 1b n=1 Tax=Pygocentrus nattereri TaxID=42514 RepID=UPI0008144762|nr:growth arrest-specific protein 1b [Pygocentrus nattereri]